MNPVLVDFNARTEDDRVRLPSRISRELASRLQSSGDWCWLTDGEVLVGAQIESGDGRYLARPAWETLEDEPADDTEAKAAVERLRALTAQPHKNYRAILKLVTAAQRALPEAGYLDYLRSRSLESLGFPHLALQAAKAGLLKEPEHAGLRYQALMMLKQVDFARAVEAATSIASSAPGTLSPALVCGCVEVLYYAALIADASTRVERETAILDLTRDLQITRDPETPRSALSLVFIVRGWILFQRGDVQAGLLELDRAVEVNPTANSYAARGLKRYPSAEAIVDLQQAIALGVLWGWPHYLLAHHFMLGRRWLEAKEHALLALHLDVSPRMRANLLQWIGIVEVESTGDLAAARRRFEEAKTLGTSPQLDENLRRLALLEDQREAPGVDWMVIGDPTEPGHPPPNLDVRLAA